MIVLPLHSSPWRNPRLYLVLLLVFVCGAGTGALVYRGLVQTSSAKASNAVWREGSKELTLRMMVKELNLTPEQSAAIETELDDFTMYYQMLQAQMDEVRATSMERIRTALNPQQRVKFDRMMEEVRGRKLQ